MDADAANPRPTNGVDDSVKRWPASYALITAWLLPATTTARMAHVTLWRAFLVHLASGVLALVAICLISSWDESRRTVPADALRRSVRRCDRRHAQGHRTLPQIVLLMGYIAHTAQGVHGVRYAWR